MNDKKNNSVFLIALIFSVVIIVFFFPNIYNVISKLSMPKVEKTEQEEPVKNVELTEDVLEDLHFPIMRNSIYENSTYYSLNEFDINKMSNNDILYNAFLDIYKGNLTDNGSYGCTNNSKQFSEEYMSLRIKNILNKAVNYSFENFYVYEDSNTDYVGEWVYDGNSKSFLYKGLCSSKASSTTYHDLTELIDVVSNNNDIIVRYYVGFAKVEENNYTIYSDADMKNIIKSGTIQNISELNDIFKNIEKNQTHTYKYTFNNSLCSYNEYCLYKGEWE